MEGFCRVPTAKWADRDFSKGQLMISDYKAFNMVDGEGVRCSVYVSGCLFKCVNCWNQVAQSFKHGTPYTKEFEDMIINDLSKSYVQGLSLLGGEPFLNTGICLPLLRRVKAEFGDSKDVWCWSGYTLEQLLAENNVDKNEMLASTDVLVDGAYIDKLRDLTLPFRGSSNQRILRKQGRGSLDFV